MTRYGLELVFRCELRPIRLRGLVMESWGWHVESIDAQADRLTQCACGECSEGTK